MNNDKWEKLKESLQNREALYKSWRNSQLNPFWKGLPNDDLFLIREMLLEMERIEIEEDAMDFSESKVFNEFFKKKCRDEWELEKWRMQDYFIKCYREGFEKDRAYIKEKDEIQERAAEKSDKNKPFRGTSWVKNIFDILLRRKHNK